MRQLKVLIVGAGFGGLAAAVELSEHAFGDITILDRAAELGGTWFYNTYPGAACDVPSPLYSFSFAQHRRWSRICAPQNEILDYLHGVARRFDLDHVIVPNTEVVSCAWDEESRQWTVASADGRTWEADAVVVATGQLHRPACPRIEGADSFAGHSFHSARWDHRYDLEGKRVAVIGTGASAVQFVPAIVDKVGRLVVFQRTANWFLPRRSRPYPRFVQSALRIPGVQAVRRRFTFYRGELLTLMIRHPRSWGRAGRAFAAGFMRWQLRDPEVRRKAWPDYTFGCKRVLFSSYFLRVLQRPNVDLVTERVARIIPTGIVTDDGIRREVDCIIYGTGFRTTEFMYPMEIIGVRGRTLREVWAEGPHAHLGLTVPGFPSMFLMYGPNTNTSAGSIVVYHEAQAAYVRQALAHVRSLGFAAIDVRPEIEKASDRQVQARFAGTAWTQCESWYLNRDGRNVANWPGSMADYIKRTRRLDTREYTFLSLPDPNR